MIELYSVPEYLDKLKEQTEKHGRDNLEAAEVKDIPSWSLLIGFSSPDGSWGVHIKRIRVWAESKGAPLFPPNASHGVTVHLFIEASANAMSGVHFSDSQT